MKVWLVIVAVAAGSYLFRISMLAVAARAGVTAVLERVTRLGIPTAFAALAATSLAGYATVGTGVLPVYVAVAAGVVAVRRTGSPRAALLVGMPTLWILSAIWH